MGLPQQGDEIFPDSLGSLRRQSWFLHLQEQNLQKSLEFTQTTFPSGPSEQGSSQRKSNVQLLGPCQFPAGSFTDLAAHLFLIYIVFNPRKVTEESEEPASSPSPLLPGSSACGSPNSGLCREVIQRHGDVGEASESSEIRSIRLCLWGAWHDHCLFYRAGKLCA